MSYRRGQFIFIQLQLGHPDSTRALRLLLVSYLNALTEYLIHPP